MSGEARDISPTLYVYTDPVADVELRCNVGTFWGCPLNPAIEHGGSESPRVTTLGQSMNSSKKNVRKKCPIAQKFEQISKHRPWESACMSHRK